MQQNGPQGDECPSPSTQSISHLNSGLPSRPPVAERWPEGRRAAACANRDRASDRFVAADGRINKTRFSEGAHGYRG
jgi:hypothetical protein